MNMILCKNDEKLFIMNMPLPNNVKSINLAGVFKSFFCYNRKLTSRNIQSIEIPRPQELHGDGVICDRRNRKRKWYCRHVPAGFSETPSDIYKGVKRFKPNDASRDFYAIAHLYIFGEKFSKPTIPHQISSAILRNVFWSANVCKITNRWALVTPVTLKAEHAYCG